MSAGTTCTHRSAISFNKMCGFPWIVLYHLCLCQYQIHHLFQCQYFLSMNGMKMLSVLPNINIINFLALFQFKLFFFPVAQRETRAYEEHKQSNAAKCFSYVGTVGELIVLMMFFFLFFKADP